jgi:hypothetical protein
MGAEMSVYGADYEMPNFGVSGPGCSDDTTAINHQRLLREYPCGFENNRQNGLHASFRNTVCSMFSCQ